MRANRWQHFLPQFYLRFFATSANERQIGLYNLKSGIFADHAPIRDQSAENYFYKSVDLEKALANFEGKLAPIFRNILTERKLPERKTQPFEDMLLFILLQRVRTRFALDQHDEGLKKLKELVLAGHPESALPPQLQDEIENVPLFLMRITMDNAWAARDLRGKLLLNDSPIPFVTSDNPVVFYNQFLERRRVPGGRTGTGCKGLQVFFPLNEHVLLVLFDGEVYSVGGKKLSSQRVEITAKDVHQINRLQAINAHKNIYFGNSATHDYIWQLVGETTSFRRHELSVVKEYPSAEPCWVAPRGSLIVQHLAEIDANIDLSFVRITPLAMKYDHRNKGAHLRDERVLKHSDDRIMKRFADRLVGPELAGVYGPSDTGLMRGVLAPVCFNS